MAKADDAYSYIYQSILDRKLLPGSSLVESDLSKALNMSRTPIREALNRLISEKMVESNRSRGFIVSSFSSEKILCIYQVIEALEGMICYLVALDHENIDFSQLTMSVCEMEEATKKQDWDSWIKSDAKFHDQMIHNCRNNYLSEEGNKYKELIKHIRAIITRAYIDKAKSTHDHREMLNQMKSGNAEGARTAAHKHYNRIGKQIALLINSGVILGGF